MDPTAPDNNDQNPQGPPPTPSPIQPGQFVVTSKDSLQAQNQIPNATQPQPEPSSSTPQASGPLQTPPNPAPTGFAQAYTANNSQDTTFQSQGLPKNPTQPDPTPFTPPIAQGPQEQPPGEDSKSKVIKIVGIILGVVALLAIIGGLVWFFVLNKGAKEDINTIQEDFISEPSPAVQNPQPGFGELPEATTSPLPSPPIDNQSEVPDPSETNPPPQ